MATRVGGITLDTRRLDEIIARTPGEAENIVNSTAIAVQGKAAALAPVDTGALASSIHVEDTADLTRIVADAVEYGIYQELGTYRMAAQPFMIPALNWARPKFESRWRELIR